LKVSFSTFHLARPHEARSATVPAVTGRSVMYAVATVSLKHQAVVTAFPELAQLVLAIQSVEEKIRLSRESQKHRDHLYEVVEDFDCPHLLDLFRRFQASEPIMKAIADRHRRDRSMGRWAIIIAAGAPVLAAVGVSYEVAKDYGFSLFPSRSETKNVR
jgi:hypothetical protein